MAQESIRIEGLPGLVYVSCDLGAASVQGVINVPARVSQDEVPGVHSEPGAVRSLGIQVSRASQDSRPHG